jgi:hypothetical protein
MGIEVDPSSRACLPELRWRCGRTIPKSSAV